MNELIDTLSVDGCGDAYIMRDISRPVARLTITGGADVYIGVDDWDDDSDTYPIQIAFGEYGQMSVSLLPDDVAKLVGLLQNVLRHGI